MLLVSFTSALASPFGYMGLNYIDYITFILAKSCKLLPVMALHITVFRKRYPLYKYAVIALVTLGVALFTLHQPENSAKAAKRLSKKSMSTEQTSTYWGLFLLSINLLFDGVTNSTQDYIFTAFKPYSGPQMMCAHNLLQTVITTVYLLAAPYVAVTPVGQWIGMNSTSNELVDALAFIQRHPRVGYDVLAFSLCGAVGQVFIFHTLQVYSSLLLVTVTVTRKMMSMILSVIWFGHKIQGMQWLGVALVFSGIGGEAIMNRKEKLEKQRKERRRRLSLEGRERKRLAELGIPANGSAIEDKKQR
jgi:UDP-galactose transporter B1